MPSIAFMLHGARLCLYFRYVLGNSSVLLKVERPHARFPMAHMNCVCSFHFIFASLISSTAISVAKGLKATQTSITNSFGLSSSVRFFLNLDMDLQTRYAANFTTVCQGLVRKNSPHITCFFRINYLSLSSIKHNTYVDIYRTYRYPYYHANLH